MITMIAPRQRPSQLATDPPLKLARPDCKAGAQPKTRPIVVRVLAALQSHITGACYSQQEIADALGIAKPTVNGWLDNLFTNGSLAKSEQVLADHLDERFRLMPAARAGGLLPGKTTLPSSRNFSATMALTIVPPSTPPSLISRKYASASRLRMKPLLAARYLLASKTKSSRFGEVTKDELRAVARPAGRRVGASVQMDEGLSGDSAGFNGSRELPEAHVS